MNIFNMFKGVKTLYNEVDFTFGIFRGVSLKVFVDK